MGLFLSKNSNSKVSNSQELLSFNRLPQHILIDAIILPFFDIFSKIQLRRISSSADTTITHNLLTNEDIKKELQHLLFIQYHHNPNLTNHLSNIQCFKIFLKFSKVEKNSLYLSKLGEYKQEKESWVLAKNPENAFKNTLSKIVQYESIFQSKLSLFSKENPNLNTKYEYHLKTVLEILIDLSKTESTYNDNQEMIKTLYGHTALMINCFDEALPSLRVEKKPTYMSNYRSGLLAFYHYLKAFEFPDKANEYLTNNSPQKKNRYP
ncbi:MAG: hypothetical protein LEGION0398_MBIBDBAK_00317 [Legionellaceae bacterium]